MSKGVKRMGVGWMREALEASNNHATDIHQQAVALIQSLDEAASQEVQRLIEFGTQVEARANKVLDVEPLHIER